MFANIFPNTFVYLTCVLMLLFAPPHAVFASDAEKCGHYYDHAMYSYALSPCERAAMLGDVGAHVTLGKMYQHGDGVTLDLGEAEKWYKLAAEQGNAEAQSIISSSFTSTITTVESATAGTSTKPADGFIASFQAAISDFIDAIIDPLLYALGFIVFVWFVKGMIKHSKEEKEARIKRMEEYISKIKQRGGLGAVKSSAILKAGEIAYFHSNTTLREARAVRHYKSASAGIPVAKGVRVGASRGKSVSKLEMTELDRGTLTVTNQRLIFSGSDVSRVVPIGKVVKATAVHNFIEISAESRQKSMQFTVPNPSKARAVVKICARMPDPGNLPAEVIDTFVGWLDQRDF